MVKDLKIQQAKEIVHVYDISSVKLAQTRNDVKSKEEIKKNLKSKIEAKQQERRIEDGA